MWTVCDELHLWEEGVVVPNEDFEDYIEQEEVEIIDTF